MPQTKQERITTEGDNKYQEDTIKGSKRQCTKNILLMLKHTLSTFHL